MATDQGKDKKEILQARVESVQLSRYETKCIHCGCVLRKIDEPQKKYCYCGKIYAQNGCVFDAIPDSEEKSQGSLFD